MKKESNILNYKTEQQLIKALAILLHEMSFEKISVKDICDKAGVNRATFYNHFKNKEDLYIRNLLYWRNNIFFNKVSYSPNASFIEKLTTYLTVFFEMIYKDKDRLSIFYSNGKIDFYYTVFVNYFTDDFVDMIENSTDIPHEHSDLNSAFLVGGVANLAYSWISNGFQTEISTMVDNLISLIKNPL